MAVPTAPDIVARAVELIPTTPVRAVARELGIATDTVRTIRNKHYPHLARHEPNKTPLCAITDRVARPTKAMPGTRAKLRVMAARLRAGRPLYHPNDAQGRLPARELADERRHRKRGWRFLDRPLEMPVLTLGIDEEANW